MIVTRRGVLTAAACLTGAAVVASLMRSGTGGFKSTMTTLFWVGEPFDADNDFIPNDVSYWDNQWQLSSAALMIQSIGMAIGQPSSNPMKIRFMSRCHLASSNRRVVTSLGRMR